MIALDELMAVPASVSMADSALALDGIQTMIDAPGAHPMPIRKTTAFPQEGAKCIAKTMNTDPEHEERYAYEAPQCKSNQPQSAQEPFSFFGKSSTPTP